MRKPRHVLAIDQGTTGTHVFVIDSRLRVVGSAYQEFKQYFTGPGQVEHDLGEIWTTVERCIGAALRRAKLGKHDIAALGITNQRETIGLWRDNGRPLGRAIVWQDRRTAPLCENLQARGLLADVRARTGLVLDPYFSATKLSWLLEHTPKAQALLSAGQLRAGTIDTWLLYRLTGGRCFATDVSNASRTQLFNINTLSWDDELLRLFKVPRAVLPEVRPSSGLFGLTHGMTSLPDGIPVSGIAGDQQAALFGQACFEPGQAKCTYGTGAFLLMNTGAACVPSASGLLTTVAWQVDGRTSYALEGSAFIAGAAVQWLRDGLGFFKSASEVERLAGQVKDSAGVLFVPALAGLGAPWWRPEARGLLCGLDRGTTRAHIARAVLDGVALQIHALAQAMAQDARRELTSLAVDGGACANDLLMHIQANVLGVPVVRPRNIQTTGLGAAFLAGLATGLWKDQRDIQRAFRADKTFRPTWDDAQRRTTLERWTHAVSRA